MGSVGRRGLIRPPSMRGANEGRLTQHRQQRQDACCTSCCVQARTTRRAVLGGANADAIARRARRGRGGRKRKEGRRDVKMETAGGLLAWLLAGLWVVTGFDGRPGRWQDGRRVFGSVALSRLLRSRPISVCGRPRDQGQGRKEEWRKVCCRASGRLRQTWKPGRARGTGTASSASTGGTTALPSTRASWFVLAVMESSPGTLRPLGEVRSDLR